MTMMTMTDDNWTRIVRESDTVLVSFGSTYCPPCRAAEPALEQLSEQLADRLKVARMDVEEHPGLAGMLGIMGTPTFVLFRGGEPVNKSVGYRSKEALFATVRAWLEAK